MKFILEGKKVEFKYSLRKEFMREERGAPSTRGISKAKPRFRVQTPLPHQPSHKLQNKRNIDKNKKINYIFIIFIEESINGYF